MSVLAQTLAGLRRRPGRTLLTAVGAALGIATIVALLAVSGAAKRSAGDLVHLGRSDLGLFQKDAADPTTSVLPQSLVGRLRRTPGIAAATPLVLLVEDVRRDPAAVVFGGDPRGFLLQRLVFLRGRMFRTRREVVVGDGLAHSLGLRVGGTLRVKKRRLRVVGVYHIGVAYQDSGAFVALKTAQAIAGRRDEATTIPVKLAPGSRPAAVERTLAARYPGLLVISDPEEATRAGANGRLVTKAGAVIAALALLIGGIGVMNTMLMAVVERRSELALLSAVGWSGPQVAGLVLTEGVVVSLIGAALGLALGTVGAGLLVHALGAQAFVSPDVTAWDLGRGLLVGVAIGVLGGVYPAWRAARVSPARVLARE